MFIDKVTARAVLAGERLEFRDGIQLGPGRLGAAFRAFSLGSAASQGMSESHPGAMHARSDWQEAGHATRNGCGTKRRESGVSMPNFAENSEPTMLRFVGHKVSITRAVKVAVRTEEPFALAG